MYSRRARNVLLKYILGNPVSKQFLFYPEQVIKLILQKDGHMGECWIIQLAQREVCNLLPQTTEWLFGHHTLMEFKDYAERVSKRDELSSHLHHLALSQDHTSHTHTYFYRIKSWDCSKINLLRHKNRQEENADPQDLNKCLCSQIQDGN